MTTPRTTALSEPFISATRPRGRRGGRDLSCRYRRSRRRGLRGRHRVEGGDDLELVDVRTRLAVRRVAESLVARLSGQRLIRVVRKLRGVDPDPGHAIDVLERGHEARDGVLAL